MIPDDEVQRPIKRPRLEESFQNNAYNAEEAPDSLCSSGISFATKNSAGFTTDKATFGTNAGHIHDLIGNPIDTNTYFGAYEPSPLDSYIPQSQTQTSDWGLILPQRLEFGHSSFVASQSSADIPMQSPSFQLDPSKLPVPGSPTGSTDTLAAEGLDVLANAQKADIGGKNNVQICFGVISGIAATYERQASGELASSFPVELDSSSCFSSGKFNFIRGRIQPEHGQMIEGLLDEKSLRVYAMCTVDVEPIAKKRSRSHMLWPCTLDLTIYGPVDLFDVIGGWFQDYEVYLQDPRVCHSDTRYCNPQRLSSDDLDSCPLVSEVVSQPTISTPKELPERPDFLDILSSHIDLEETPQPSSIRRYLKSHQKQALTFMLNREQGWGCNYKQPDIWETRDSGSRRVFLNTISRVCQPEEPPGFKGGIIADPMGLGKTLTMISLVATDLEATNPLTDDISLEDPETGKPDIAATLVIIPPPLLSTWEEQLLDHVVEGGLSCRRHHGKSRVIGIEEFGAVNIVLTTYHTVSAEWKAGQDTGKAPLFAVRWRRIILDEAHFIRNGNARMARAVCDLEAISRWAVTGTPIQNRLGDLASLLKFIRAYPYTDPKHFDADVSQLWKSGQYEDAVNRLKRLSACLLLRRPKGTIELLPRRDLVLSIEFTVQERAVYEHIRHQTITNIDEALRNETDPSKSHMYVNVLQQIESLRLFSNLGLHYHSRHAKPHQQFPKTEEWRNIAQRTFNSQRDMTTITCLECSSAVGLTETLLDDSVHPIESAQYTNCLRYICSDCVGKLNRARLPVSCGHEPSCASAPVSTSGASLEEIESFNVPKHQIPLPSKVKALIEDIKRVPSDVKCIVFSTWRLTLDLVKVGLDQAEIPSIRFDGRVSLKDRQLAVAKFKSDPKVRIMLLTLSCGAVGLTLTAASRAYLMEPHWNPTLEEQALARIHRLGQNREVETVRFYVRDSFEEQVIKVQESKKQLASVLLSPHDSEYTDSNLGMLEQLRSLL